MEELLAKISGVFFENRQTGYYILKVTPDGNGRHVSVKGSFPGVSISVGLRAKFTGTFETHPTYGRQMQASACEIIPEEGRNGIITYLSSNVPSIGPITAAKMYDALGDDLIRILDEDPNQINSLPFLSRRQVEAILKEWKESSENRTSAIFLADLGLNQGQIKRIFSKFGMKTRDVVRQDPYILCECDGIGFSTADGAARKLGIDRDDIRRVRAMILFSVNEISAMEGHMFCRSSDILEHISKRMFRHHSIEPFSHGEYVSDSHFYAALQDLIKDDKLISDDDRIYTKLNWMYERDSAECLSYTIRRGPRDFGNLHDALLDFETSCGIALSEEQRQAFLMLEKSRVCVVTGNPGTGKTTLISAFVDLFERRNLHYVLLSPTGIAAKRLSQVTGKSAYTIHRALGYKRDGGWDFNRGNKFVADAIIVDEMSMVDGNTFYHLISALHPDTVVIFVGDKEQLPSVGAGYVLNSLIHCGDVPNVALTRIYRQDRKSSIITVAHQILRKELVDTKFDKESEFVYLEYPQDMVLEEIRKVASLLKSKDRNFQVIAPTYKGDLGVNNLNNCLRNVLNSEFTSGRAQKLKNGDVDFYEGDRIMVTKNDYDRTIFNGDVGKIQRISIKSDEVEVKIFDWFDQESSIPRYVDKVFTFKIEEARHVLKVAYACTAHKCISPDTLVETPDGLVRIKDIPDHGLIAGSGPRQYKNKVTNPSGPMLRVTTRDGYAVEVTPDHGMLVWDDDLGYVRKSASELKNGDILSLRLGAQWSDQPPVRLPSPLSGHQNEKTYQTPEFLTAEVAEFFGLMVADGTIFHNGFRLIKSSPDVIDRFIDLCRSIFDLEPKYINHNGTPGVEVLSSFLARWLMDIGGMCPRDKYIPSLILRSSMDIQSSFLRGVFEDGTVNIDPKRGIVDHIELVTIYKRLFCDLKVMLLRFGIISGFGERRKLLGNGSIGVYWNIYIYGSNVRLFANKIGFITKEKHVRANMPSGIDRNYQVPVLKHEALAIRDANGGPKFFSYSDKNVFMRRRMSRCQLKSMLSRVRIDTNESDSLRERLDFHHSPVLHIEEFEGPSMCIEVPEDNKFLQNGFLLFNCQGQEYDYVIMPMTMQYGIMLYKNLVYTAITRAKKKVFMFGDPKAFTHAIMNDRETTRNSNLENLISGFLNNPSSTSTEDLHFSGV